MGNFWPDRRCWRAPNSPDVVLFHSRYNWEFIPHTHDAATVLIVTDGAVEVGVGTQRYIAKAGQLAIIGANQVHSARPAASDGWEMRSLHLPTSEISRATGIPIDQCMRMHFTDPVHSMGSLGSMFLDLHRCTESMNTNCGDLHAFVRYLYDNIEIFGPSISAENYPAERVIKAKKILTDSVADNIQISEIAEEVGLSVFSLIRQFEKAFGISPHAWRIQARANEPPDCCATIPRPLRQRRFAVSRINRTWSGYSREFSRITPGQYCMLH